jgi:hypothetical protein
MSSSENSIFESLVVLQFSPTTPTETKEWVVKRFTAGSDQDDGADLLVRYDTDPQSHVRKMIFSFAYDYSLFSIRIIFF